jgi:hypothetical protein
MWGGVPPDNPFLVECVLERKFAKEYGISPDELKGLDLVKVDIWLMLDAEEAKREEFKLKKENG